MPLIFAKWIITSAITLTAGTGIEWPQMAAQQLAPPAITEQVVIEDIWTPGTICPSGDPTCVPSPGGFTAGSRSQLYCVERGVWTVNFRMGTRPGPVGTNGYGRVWLSGPEAIHLLEFAGSQTAWPTYATTVTVATEGQACWRLVYDLWGTVVINEDPRVTRLTIHRAG